MIEAIYLYIILYKKHKDMLNPFGISCVIMLITAAISLLNPGNILSKWHILTHLSVQAFSLVVFAIGFIQPVNEKKNNVRFINISTLGNSKFLSYSVYFFLISFVCALYEWYKNGLIVTLINSDSTIDLKSELISFSGVHYGTVCLPYCAVISFYKLLYIKMSKKKFVLNILVIAFTIFYELFVEMSRGTMLILLLSLIVIYDRKKKISVIKLLRYGALIIAFMILFMMIRVANRNSLVYTGTGGYTWWSPVYMYIGTCFDNLNTLVTSNNKLTLGYITVLKPILEVLGFELNIEYIQYNYFFFNARTMLYPFYHDLGVLGVVIFTAIIYSVVAFIYKKSTYDDRYLILFASLQKCIFMPFFGNYFTGVFCNTFPFIAIWFLIVLSDNLRFKKII